MLPFEIHDLICSFIQDLAGSRSTLCSYSLVCHQFHSIAKKFIFGNAMFTLSHGRESGYKQADRLREILISSPDICSLVHTLAIRDNNSAILQSSYLSLDMFILKALPRLIHLKKFSFASTGIGSTRWSSIWWTSAFAQVCHGYITHLTLYRIIDVPLELIDGCTALENLSLCLITFPVLEMQLLLDDGLTTRTRKCKMSKLKSLELMLADVILRFISRWFTSSSCNIDISELEYLSATMTLEYYDHEHINRIVQACSTSLTVFCFSPTLNVQTSVAQSVDSVNICALPCLRILRLRVGINSRLRSHHSTKLYPWVHDFIAQLKGSRTISEVSLKITLAREINLGVSLGIGNAIDMSDWSPLDTLLASLSIFSLQRFRIILLKAEFLHSEVIQQVKGYLPRTRERGILRIEQASDVGGFLCGE